VGTNGVVDDAYDGHLVDAEGEGDAHAGEGVDEVCGAVDRVTDEGGLVGEFLAGNIGFFSEEAM
jgi:hypothetical protein